MGKPQKTTNMKAVIFAGGVGTRMWPLSRKKSPKQFEKIVGSKSTLQLMVERLRPEFDWGDIYISTGDQYTKIISQQVPQIPKSNIIGEPEMRDVAPAIGYVTGILAKDDPDQPFAILWSDHLIENVEVFKNILKAGGSYISAHPDKILFIGQKARFANQNLGWIERGGKATSLNDFSVYRFKSWHYRPSLKTAKKYLRSPRYSWNPGYFIATPRFILDKYQQYMPDMYSKLQNLHQTIGKSNHKSTLKKIYPALEKISFDNAIIERIPSQQAMVLAADMGWSDIGAWIALKEALQDNPQDNTTHGKTHLHNTKDTLVYNYTNKLVTTIDLNGMLVVVTDDVIMVCPEESVPEIKKVVRGFEATANEKYT